MPVSTTTNQTAVTLATTTDAIPIAFPFFDASDLVVILTDGDGVDTTLTISTHYTVSGGDGSTGTVTLTGTLVQVGETVTVVRNVPLTSSLDLEDGDPLPSTALERAIDRVTIQIQQIGAKVARCFRVGATTAAPAEAGIASPASTLLGYTAAGVFGSLTADQVVELLNLDAMVVDRPTKVFSDATARAAAAPDFIGQLGVQLDTVVPYIGNGLTAGDWTAYEPPPADGSITAAKLATDAVETAKIKDKAVTFAKMQDISATARVLGRKTAAAGVTEELTLSELLDLVGSAAQGDILFRGASGWTRLGAGTSGQFLKTLGVGADPAWASAGTPAVIRIQEQYSDTTDPTALTTGGWRTRVLNTEVEDAGGHASLSSNQITLAAGTYQFHLLVADVNTTGSRVRLQNVTDGATVLQSMSGYTSAVTNDWVILNGLFTLASAKALEIQHYIASAYGLNAGRDDGLTLGVEVYVDALFYKIA